MIARVTTVTTEATVTVDGEEFEVTCEFDFSPPERGSREAGTGLQMEPDYSAQATLLTAKTEDGEDLYDKLDPTEVERLENDALIAADTPDDDGPDYDPSEDIDWDSYIGPD